MRSLAAFLILVLTGLPLIVLPSSGLVAAVGALAMALSFAGLLALWIPALTAGAALALAEYALALWLAGGPPDLLPAIAFGVELLLLLEAADFARRFRGVAVSPSVIRSHARSWSGIAGVAAGSALVLGAGASALAPLLGHPIAAAAGALVAFLAAVGALRLGRERQGSSR